MRFGGDGVESESFLAPEPVARRGDRVAFSHGVKAGLLLQLLSEFLAARFEELDVADAVSLHVPFQMEGVVIVDLVGIPSLEFGFFSWRTHRLDRSWRLVAWVPGTLGCLGC